MRPGFATDLNSTIVWDATYLPFGGVQTSTGANLDLRFPGQWFQSEAGLHQNWMRDYDPTLGRYLQADPLGLVDGASVYGYVTQNPGRYVDPRGEQEVDFFGLGDLTNRGFTYDPRVLHPRDSGPNHNFPFAYDMEIWSAGWDCGFGLRTSGANLNFGYYDCRCVPGHLNGRPGKYEIGVRVPFLWEGLFGFGRYQPTVVHRFFVPD